MRGGRRKQLTLPDIKTYYKARAVKWDNDKRTGKKTNEEDCCSETNKGVYKNLIYNKGGNTNKWGKNELFSEAL